MIHAPLLAASVVLLAHNAPSGMLYNQGCCGGHDCRPISEDALIQYPSGWRIRATNEFFPNGHVLSSTDGQFHRCSAGGRDDGRTFCLYVPPRGS